MQLQREFQSSQLKAGLKDKLDIQLTILNQEIEKLSTEKDNYLNEINDLQSNSDIM